MDNIKRITSGVIIGIALAIILLIPNNIITGIIFAIIAATAMHEYLNAISKVCKPVKWLAYLSCIIVAIPSFVNTKELEQYLIFAIPIILVLLFAKVIATDMKTSFKDISYTLLGICYIPTFLMFMTMTEKLQNGKFLLGYIFIAAWGTDIFAYSVGRRIGKHKFSNVRPKKSIEGCVCVTLGAILLAIILTLILNNNFVFEYSYFVSLPCLCHIIGPNPIENSFTCTLQSLATIMCPASCINIKNPSKKIIFKIEIITVKLAFPPHFLILYYKYFCK